MTIPRLWVRLVWVGMLVLLAALWSAGPIPDLFGRGLRVQPVVVALACATTYRAFTFKRVIVDAHGGLTIAHYIVGIPRSRYHGRSEIECLGTDYQGLDVVFFILNAISRPSLSSLSHLSSEREDIGTMRLFVVLRNGRRMQVYKGRSDSFLNELTSISRAGFGCQCVGCSRDEQRRSLGQRFSRAGGELRQERSGIERDVEATRNAQRPRFMGALTS